MGSSSREDDACLRVISIINHNNNAREFEKIYAGIKRNKHVDARRKIHIEKLVINLVDSQSARFHFIFLD